MRACPLLLALMAVVIALAPGGAHAAAAHVVNVSAAYGHTVVLADDGTVWTWGWAGTAWGILGTGADQGDGGFRQVAGLSNIVAVDASFLTSLALDRDGHVWAWGDDRNDQCGVDATAACPSPVRIAGLERIVQVSCGGTGGAAVDQDGHVWAWGDNFYGQLGIGREGTPQATPVRVPIEAVKMVAAGNGYVVALKKDGTVWAWGENDKGQSGGYTTANVLTPVQVGGLYDIVEIDAGSDHTLALRADGTVWAWGDGEENKLCNGQGYLDAPACPVPAQVSGLPSIVEVAAGSHGSTVLAEDGSVYAWGSNGDGQYGNGIDLWTPAQTPQKVPGLDDAVTLTAGYGHCVVAQKDGSVWAWGKNDEDQIQFGLGKKVMSPMKKLDGSAAISPQSTIKPTADAGATAPTGSDISGFITIAGVAILVLAVALVLVLLRLRKG